MSFVIILDNSAKRNRYYSPEVCTVGLYKNKMIPIGWQYTLLYFLSFCHDIHVLFKIFIQSSGMIPNTQSLTLFH